MTEHTHENTAAVTTDGLVDWLNVVLNAHETTEVVSRDGLADWLKVSRRTASRVVREPGFPKPLRVRGCVRWVKEEVLAYLKSRKAPAHKSER